MVPAYTGAAFAKRFARLALRVPPFGSMVCLSFIHNLMRRHPACNQMLHRQGAAEAAAGPSQDPFDESAEDPAASRALESSLWEVAALSKHYHWQVAQFAGGLLEKDLANKAKTADVDIDPLAALSFAGMVSQENERKLKQVATAFYPMPPKRLFDANSADDFAGIQLA